MRHDPAPSTATAPRRVMSPLRLGAVTGTLLMALALPMPASAQSCVGFTDVLATSPFCASVEWIKNRGVTTGCTATTYCANDAVTRLSMAAFLKRLGDALTPVDLAPVSSAGSTVTPNAQPVLCATPDYTATGFPRRAYVNAAAILSAPSGNIDVGAAVVYSTNGGLTWTPIANSDQYAALYGAQTPASHATLSPFGSVDVNVGQPIRFGVRLLQYAGTGTVTAACTNRVQVWNRNGTSSPYDSQPAAAFKSPAG